MYAIEVFECPECEEVWYDELQAAVCCNPRPYLMYECQECESIYSSETQADRCCENTQERTREYYDE